MKGRLVVAGLLAALVVVVAWRATPEAVGPSTFLAHPARPPSTPVVDRVAPPETDPVWASSAARLADACGLDVASACSHAGCAVLATTPDLDRTAGWLRLGWAHPSLVAASVLGDLGIVPRTALPCDAAIAALSSSGDTRVAIGDGPDGTWLACVFTAPVEGSDAPCASLAEAHGLPWRVSDPTRRW